MGGQFLLYVQVPLLDVRPDSLVRDGNDGKRKEVYQSSPSADAGISALSCGASADSTGDVGLRRRKHEWGGALQRFAVAFAAVCGIVEDPVAAADGHLAVAFGIPSEPDTRGGIEKMSLEAASV